MKDVRGLLFLVLVFSFSFSFAIADPQLQMDNSFRFGETILGTINMGDSEIISGDINFEFKQGRKFIDPNFDVIEYDGNYYFYMYPSSKGDYSLNIDGILYRQGNLTKGLVLTKNFSIIESNEVLSVKPGLIYTVGETKIRITNKGNTTISGNSPDGSFSLNTLESIDVTIDPTYEISFFEVSSYKTFKIPVIYYGGSEVSDNNDTNPDIDDENSTGPLILRKSIKVDPKNITLNFESFDDIETNIEIENDGDLDLDLDFYSEDYSISIENVSLNKGDSISIDLKFSYGDESGSIFVSYGNNEIEVPIYISVENDLFESNNTCSDLGGVFCDSTLNLTCSGDSKYTADFDDNNGTLCCIGTCVKNKSSSSSGGFWIGILILLVLGVGGFFIYKRYNNVGKIGSDKRIREENEAKKKELEKKEAMKDGVNNKK